MPNHIVKPLFLEESKDTLLKKCLHDKTQNVKEALNNLISTKRPNNVYVARKVLEMWVYSAVINFNNGVCGILNVFRGANMEPEYFMEIFSIKNNRLRVISINKKSISEAKIRR